LIINASRIEADTNWLNERLNALRTARPLPCETCQIRQAPSPCKAQGGELYQPMLSRLIQGRCHRPEPGELEKNQVSGFNCEGANVWVARTGYTGEDGFEVVAQAQAIESVFHRILEAGKECGLKPAGWERVIRFGPRFVTRCTAMNWTPKPRPLRLAWAFRFAR